MGGFAEGRASEGEASATLAAGASGCYVGVVSRWSRSLGIGYIECKESALTFGGDIQVLQDQFGDLEVSDTVLFQVSNEPAQGGARKAAFAKQIKELTLQRRRILAAEVPCPQPGSEAPQEFLGFITSFGPASGFGFITCAQTRQIYNAEVYILRDQYIDANVGDAVHFQVALNTKGSPVARGVRKAVGGGFGGGSAAPAAPAPAAAAPPKAKTRSRSRSGSSSMSISGERKGGKRSKKKSRGRSRSRSRKRKKRSRS